MMMINCFCLEAVSWWCSVKKVFLKIQGPGHRPETLLKKRLWHRCFPVNFAKFLRTPFLQNIWDDCFWILQIEKANIHLLFCPRYASFTNRMMCNHLIKPKGKRRKRPVNVSFHNKQWFRKTRKYLRKTSLIQPIVKVQTKHSIMDQVKFVEDSLRKSFELIWSD